MKNSRQTSVMQEAVRCRGCLPLARSARSAPLSLPPATSHLPQAHPSLRIPPHLPFSTCPPDALGLPHQSWSPDSRIHLLTCSPFPNHPHLLTHLPLIISAVLRRVRPARHRFLLLCQLLMLSHLYLLLTSCLLPATCVLTCCLLLTRLAPPDWLAV